jgi:hypothetical protein
MVSNLIGDSTNKNWWNKIKNHGDIMGISWGYSEITPSGIWSHLHRTTILEMLFYIFWGFTIHGTNRVMSSSPNYEGESSKLFLLLCVNQFPENRRSEHSKIWV